MKQKQSNRETQVQSFCTPRILAFVLVAALTGNGPASAQITWEPVWSDEFDGTSVDESKWSFQLGDGCDIGLCQWGNNELQSYRSENASVTGGRLIITAREESFGGYSYTSARMRTIGKGDWRYGRFEIAAKLPKGKGLWPAIWMLPTETIYGVWAASGEIDIMEMRGSIPDVVQGTIYYGRTSPDQVTTTAFYTLPSGDFSTDFHEFALEWDPRELRWYVDDVLYRTENNWFSENGNYPAPFDTEFHLLLNVAVGGDYDGPPDASTVFPQTMEVDYVHVYRATNVNPVVDLSQPTEGQVLTPGGSLTLASGATDPDGTIEKVDFFQEDGLLGSDRQPPYELEVSDLTPGCYTVYAVATDDDGRIGSSDTVSVQVGDLCPDRAPYLMSPVKIPGIVEAEYYDIGGEDVAYNDTDVGNAGGAPIRTSENVDLSHAGSDVGYAVVRTNRTEWLEYEVNVESAGNYNALVRVGSTAAAATLRLEFDGVDATGSVSVPTTGGQTDWTTLVIPDLPLTAGVQTMRLVLNSAGLGINRIQFQRSTSTALEPESGPSDVRILSSYPSPATSSATIEYELVHPTDVELKLFDLLGRSVAVLDSGSRGAGNHRVTVDTSGLPSGVYVYRLTANSVQISRPFLIRP